MEHKLIDSRVLAEFCEQEYGLPLLDLDAFNLAEIPHKYLNHTLIEKHRITSYNVCYTKLLR